MDLAVFGTTTDSQQRLWILLGTAILTVAVIYLIFRHFGGK
jgi:hypothetical protein